MNNVWLTSRTPLNYCPMCNARMDAATSVEGSAVPKPGGVALCIHCGSVLRFNGELGLRVVTPDEIRDFPAHDFQRIALLQNAIYKLLIDKANRNG